MCDASFLPRTHTLFISGGLTTNQVCLTKPRPLPVNRVANNGFKPFEMLFKASRCDDVDMVKSFAGEFNTKLGGMVRIRV